MHSISGTADVKSTSELAHAHLSISGVTAPHMQQLLQQQLITQTLIMMHSIRDFLANGWGGKARSLVSKITKLHASQLVLAESCQK
jgi:hypothetical protein